MEWVSVCFVCVSVCAPCVQMLHTTPCGAVWKDEVRQIIARWTDRERQKHRHKERFFRSTKKNPFCLTYPKRHEKVWKGKKLKHVHFCDTNILKLSSHNDQFSAAELRALRWTDTWSHSADDKLQSRLELDIVIIEGKQAVTAVTVAAAQAQQTPQGTLPTVTFSCYLWNLQGSRRSQTDKEKSPGSDWVEKWKLYCQQVTTGHIQYMEPSRSSLQGDKCLGIVWKCNEESTNRWLGFYCSMWHDLNCMLEIRASIVSAQQGEIKC